MCVARTQLYQCCCLPDGLLNHLRLLKYHGNFSKCRSSQHSTVARFQFPTLHPPCFFALLCWAALLLSSCAPEAAAWAPAEPRTSQGLQNLAFARPQVVIAAQYKVNLHSLSPCRCMSPVRLNALYNGGISGEAVPLWTGMPPHLP